MRGALLLLALGALVGGAQAEASARSCFVGCWNPHNLIGAFRLDEVSAVLRSVGVVALPGTAVKAWQNEAHHAANAAFHHVVQFGWQRGRLITKACGCAIMVNKRWFGKNSLRRIIAPPAPLRGRGGLAYLVSGPVMIAIMVLYFPPRPSKAGSAAVYRDTCTQLLKWAQTEYAAIPQRFTPMICMDLNGGLKYDEQSDAVGPHGAPVEHVYAQRLHEWMDTVGLCAINTFSPCGNTFEGNSGASQIDYILVPTAARPLVKWTATWRRAAQEGRAMAAVLDHIPIVLKMKMVPPIDITPLRERWDRTKIREATLTGEGREPFLKEIQELLETHRPSFDILESREVTTGHTALLMTMIRNVGLKHFSQAPVHDPRKAAMDARKWDLLKARRALLSSARAKDVADEVDDAGVANYTKQIKAYSNALANHRRRMLEARQAATEGELAEAWRRRDMAAVPRLSRSLAKTGIGIKNRNYRANPSFSPSALEWSTFLQLPPLEGGLGGESVTVPWCVEVSGERYDQLANIDEYAHPDNYEVTLPMRKQAQEDFRRTCKAIRKSKLGRYAPRWSAPVELYKILLHPTWISTPSDYWKRTAGLGSRPAPIWDDAPRTADPYAQDQLVHLGRYGEAAYRLFRLTVHIRRTGSLPIQASLSYGFAPDKKNDKPGPAGRRLLHAMCPWWRAYTRGQVMRGGPYRPPPWAFACRGRRREHLMTCTKIMAWKGVRGGQPMLHKSYDATNAFACGSKTELEDGIRERLETDPEMEERDIAFANHITRTRRDRLTVVLDAADERLAVRSGSGGFMGDTSEPEIFMHNYHHAVRAWANFERRQSNNDTTITFGRFGTVDASMGTFMDDIFKTLLIPNTMRTPAAVVRASLANDLYLDQALAARGYAQNRKKQDVVPALRSRQLTRQTTESLLASGCHAGYQLKHLGAWFNAVNSNASELKARIQAINRGWMMVKGFWYSRSPRRTKRLMFISLVSGAALSGTAAFCWTEGECRTLCSSLARKLRSLMGGTATVTDHARTMTTRDVYRYWQLVPFALEATIQRLRMWQSVLRNPANHEHFLSVFFGTMKWELDAEYACPPALTPSGEINDHPGIHPWAVQLKRDLQIVVDHPEAESFATYWCGDIHELIWDREVTELFLAFDPRALRTAFMSTAWRPPTALADSVPAEADDENTWENPAPAFCCNIVMGDGERCGASFKTRSALVAHVTQSQREGHGARSIFHIITPTNACINCGTVFQNRTEAVRHISRSWHAGRCIRNNTAYAYPFVMPRELHCTICDVTLSSYGALRSHLCSHLPPTQAGNQLSVVEPRPPRPSPVQPRRPGIANPPGVRARGSELRTLPSVLVQGDTVRQLRRQRDDGSGGAPERQGRTHAPVVASPAGNRLLGCLSEWWRRVQDRRGSQEAEGSGRRRSRSRSGRDRGGRPQAEGDAPRRTPSRPSRQGEEADHEGRRPQGAPPAADDADHGAHAEVEGHVGHPHAHDHHRGQQPGRKGHAGRGQGVRRPGPEPQRPREQAEGRGQEGEGRRQGGGNQQRGRRGRTGTSLPRPPDDGGLRGDGRVIGNAGGGEGQPYRLGGVEHSDGRQHARLREVVQAGELLRGGPDQDRVLFGQPGARDDPGGRVQGHRGPDNDGPGTSRIHGGGVECLDRCIEGVADFDEEWDIAEQEQFFGLM